MSDYTQQIPTLIFGFASGAVFSSFLQARLGKVIDSLIDERMSVRAKVRDKLWDLSDRVKRFTNEGKSHGWTQMPLNSNEMTLLLSDCYSYSEELGSELLYYSFYWTTYAGYAFSDKTSTKINEQLKDLKNLLFTSVIKLNKAAENLKKQKWTIHA